MDKPANAKRRESGERDNCFKKDQFLKVFFRRLLIWILLR